MFVTRVYVEPQITSASHRQTQASKLAEKEQSSKKATPLLEHYQRHAHVFSEQEVSRTVTPEPWRHVTVGRSHDQTGSDPPRDQAPKPASNQSCDKEREHDLMHAYFCRRNLCYVHDRY